MLGQKERSTASPVARKRVVRWMAIIVEADSPRSDLSDEDTSRALTTMLMNQVFDHDQLDVESLGPHHALPP